MRRIITVCEAIAADVCQTVVGPPESRTRIIDRSFIATPCKFGPQYYCQVLHFQPRGRMHDEVVGASTD